MPLPQHNEAALGYAPKPASQCSEPFAQADADALRVRLQAVLAKHGWERHPYGAPQFFFAFPSGEQPYCSLSGHLPPDAVKTLVELLEGLPADGCRSHECPANKVPASSCPPPADTTT